MSVPPGCDSVFCLGETVAREPDAGGSSLHLALRLRPRAV